MTTNDSSTSAGVAENQAARLDQEEALYRGMLQANPQDLSALIGLGDVLTDTHRLKDAETLYRQAVALSPDAPEAAGAYDGLAAVLQDSGDLDGAIAASKKAAVLRGNADDSFGVGNTLEFLGRIPDAIEMFKLAATQKEAFGDAHAKAAKLLLTTGKPAEAIPHYQAAAQASPEVAELHCNLANAQQQTGNTDGALDSARRAIEIKPELSEAHNIMGVLWKERRRWADSLAAFNRAIQVKPDAADAFSNMGVVLELVGREVEATAYLERAISIRPEVPQFHLNLAGNLLLRGDYLRGFSELEWRRMDPRSSAGRMFPQPMWDGSHLDGRTILIHAESPLSQTIQFLRYVKMVADRGGRIVFESQPALASLVQQIEGVAEVVLQGEVLPAFDVHCPIVSLAKVFGTTLQTVPVHVPYLKPSVEKTAEWAKLLPAGNGGLRVGLAWADRLKSAKSRDRSCTVDDLLPLADVPGVQLFNLQQLETSLPEGLKIVDLPAELKDLHDTAALIEQMDVVVGNDATASYLAAAMGKKTYMLLASTPDWRWTINRDGSAWYPTAKSLRQTNGRTWTEVVNEMVDLLRRYHTDLV